MREIDFLFCWNTAKAAWKYMLLTGILAALIAFSVSRWGMTPLYRSSVTLYFGTLTEASKNPIKAPDQLNDVNQGLSLGLQVINDYRELISTNRIREQVASRVRNTSLSGLDRYQVGVDLLKNTRMLKINVTDQSPEIACDIANAYADVFVDEVQTIIGIQNSQIIDRAKIATLPISPSIRRNTILGLFFGMALCYGIFILVGLLDSSISSVESVEQQFKLPLVGVIPYHEEADANDPSRDCIIDIKSRTGKRTHLAESFRSLRVCLQYNWKSKQQQANAKVIIITSAVASEGKSFCASNTAISLAESGMRILLINGDLRKPSLHEKFGIPNDVGLVDILDDCKDPDDVIAKNVFDLSLDVIPCGAIPSTPSSFLMSERLKDFLDSQRGNYDCILIDSPPVLGLADSLILSTHADGILMVVRAGYTQAKSVQNTISLLRQTEKPIIGIVLNRLSENNTHYGYGYYYGNKHYHAQEEDGKIVKVNKKLKAFLRINC